MSNGLSDLKRHATTSNFNKYRRMMRQVFVTEFGITVAKSKSLCELLDVLESLRVSFCKGKYCFETKRISSKEIADEMGVTERYVRILMRILEKASIIGVLRKRYDRTHNFKNRYVLCGFRTWLSTFAQAPIDPVPSSHDNDQRSLLIISNNKLTFPASRHIGKFWKVIAYEVQNVGELMPCLASLSDKFRVNIDRHQIPRNHGSIIIRWKNFVRGAIDFKKHGG